MIIIAKGKPYYLLALVVAGLSCVGSKEDKGLVTKTQMADIIIKTYLVEAKIKRVELPTDSAILLLDTFKKQLLVKKEITDSALKASYAHYLSHPKEMGEIMDIVVDSLSLWQEQHLTTVQHADSSNLPH